MKSSVFTLIEENRRRSGPGKAQQGQLEEDVCLAATLDFIVHHSTFLRTLFFLLKRMINGLPPNRTHDLFIHVFAWL